MIIRCNDFGAGGVSVAIGELADGLLIDLDAVPKKYDGLDGTELSISESQERMAVVIKEENRDAFLELAGAENLEAVQVAVVTKSPRMTMKWRDQVIVDLPRSFIDTNGAPSYASAVVEMPDMSLPYTDMASEGYVKGDFVASVKGALHSLSTCSRKGLSQRFDSTIGARTVLMPFGGKYQLTPEEGMASKIPVDSGETDAVTVMSYGFDPYYSEWSPFHGAYHAVVESLMKLLAMGADPLSARLTFQEYFERMQCEESWGKPTAALLGAYQAQLDYGTASIGGKDSMSGTFKDISVPPTLVSFAVATTTADKIVSAALSFPGQKVYAISLRKDSVGLYAKDHVLRVFKAVSEIGRRGQMLAGAVVRSGGIAARVAQMCMGNRLGFLFEDHLDMEYLFSRSMGVLLVSVQDRNAVDKIEMVGGRLIGTVTGSGALSWNGQLITLADAVKSFEDRLEPIFPTTVKEEEIRIPDIRDIRRIERKQYKGSIKLAKPTVFIPVFPGTNCEYDSAAAFEKAGAAADVMVIRNLNSKDISESISEMSRRIGKASMIMLPGGFSGGDEPEGSAKFIAAAFRNPYITEAVRDLLGERDGLMLGICNGFQALMKLGLLPYGDILPLENDGPTLTFNKIGRHQSGYVTTKIVSADSPWLSMTAPGELYEIPVSHGEGRFYVSEEQLTSLFANSQVATQYVDDKGNPTMDTAFNPNGSVQAIEGILSPDGRIFGKMGHSERMGTHIAKNIPGIKDQHIFEAGVRYFG
jgi:phosphoribosylformylglycinamidine synthase